MRCPKCHYISFEAADRCRNCGYELSLASVAPQEDPELPLHNRTEDPLPPVDLALDPGQERRGTRTAEGAASPQDIDGASGRSSADLPLFKGNTSPRRAANPRAEAEDDAPLVRPSAVPRAPIAVRRATPDAHRLRSRYSMAEVPKLDLEDPADMEQFASEEGPEPPTAAAAAAPIPAPPVRRVLAALIDLVIVAGINIGVLYFTLKLCDLPLSFAGVLEIPPVPVSGFLLLLDGGYFVSFTSVVGQTIGKMATGLRVVHLDESGRDGHQPNFGFSTLRTAAYGASILPVGLGFLPALVGKDRRALHDRLAETRVIFSGKLMV